MYTLLNDVIQLVRNPDPHRDKAWIMTRDECIRTNQEAWYLHSPRLEQMLYTCLKWRSKRQFFWYLNDSNELTVRDGYPRCKLTKNLLISANLEELPHRFRHLMTNWLIDPDNKINVLLNLEPTSNPVKPTSLIPVMKNTSRFSSCNAQNARKIWFCLDFHPESSILAYSLIWWFLCREFLHL